MKGAWTDVEAGAGDGAVLDDVVCARRRPKRHGEQREGGGRDGAEGGHVVAEEGVERDDEAQPDEEEEGQEGVELVEDSEEGVGEEPRVRGERLGVLDHARPEQDHVERVQPVEHGHE
eukprot:3041591-Rhodomonas_salina.1